MEDYEVYRLTCGEDDTNWVVSLPPFLDLQENEDDVEVTLISVSVPDLLQFNEKDRTVLLAHKNRNKVIRGQICPESNVQMTFKLQSKTLGFSIQTITIPVVRNPNVVSKAADSNRLDPLRVSKAEILADGRLTMAFNSDVRWPALQTEATSDLKRMLDAGYPISDLIKASVLESGDDDAIDITSIRLLSSSKTNLVIQVTFKNPEAISTDLKLPD